MLDLNPDTVYLCDAKAILYPYYSSYRNTTSLHVMVGFPNHNIAFSYFFPTIINGITEEHKTIQNLPWES